jgi:hypothetical protein
MANERNDNSKRDTERREQQQREQQRRDNDVQTAINTAVLGTIGS